MGDTEHQILRPSFRPPTPSLSTSSDRSSTVSSNVNSASSAPSFSTSSFADRINRKTLKNLHTPNIIFGNENLYTSNQVLYHTNDVNPRIFLFIVDYIFPLSRPAQEYRRVIPVLIENHFAVNQVLSSIPAELECHHLWYVPP